MTRSRKSLSAIAMGAALAVVLAAVALAYGAETEPYANHKPVRGNYPGSYARDASIWIATQRHPNHKPLSAARYGAAADAPVSVAAASYTNHKPLRGDYPGSYVAGAPAPDGGSSGDTFDWADAGIGAAVMLGLLLLLTAAKTGGARARQRYAA